MDKGSRRELPPLGPEHRLKHLTIAMLPKPPVCVVCGGVAIMSMTLLDSVWTDSYGRKGENVKARRVLAGGGYFPHSKDSWPSAGLVCSTQCACTVLLTWDEKVQAHEERESG